MAPSESIPPRAPRRPPQSRRSQDHRAQERQRLHRESAARLEVSHLAGLLGEFAATEPVREKLKEDCAQGFSGRDLADSVRLYRQVEEVQALLEAGHRQAFQSTLEDVKSLVATDGALDRRPLEPIELYQIGWLLQSCARTRDFLAEQRGIAPELDALFAPLPDERRFAERVLATCDPKGEILDSASPELAEIRARIERLRDELRRWMERARESAAFRSALQDRLVTVRNDRFVFPVKSTHRQKVPGIVHGESATGSTLYIEPQAIVARGDELQDFRRRERLEISKLLSELTRGAAERRLSIIKLYEARLALDLAVTKARFGRAFQAVIPELNQERRLELDRARHPLLLWREHQESGAEFFEMDRVCPRIEPLSLSLSAQRYQMIVTGPNTGGKTVVLKTLGLFAQMAGYGVPLPCRRAKLPVFDQIVADIGDEQSLEQNLSTFSGHMRVISAILGSVGSKSLVLLDELGSGTDPLEGGALGEAILTKLYERGVMAVVTTHIGRLKEFAFRHKKCLNASMEFDPERLAPTYRLMVGIPGRSNALIIARKLGLRDDVVNLAEQIMRREDSVDEEILDGMQQTQRALDTQKQELEAQRLRAEALTRERDHEVKAAHDLKQSLEHEAEQAEEARVREVVGQIREALKQLGQLPADRQPALEALETCLREAEQQTSLAVRRRERALKLRKGDSVFVPKLQSLCVVKTINKTKEELKVTYSGVETAISFGDISWITPPPGFEGEWYE